MIVRNSVFQGNHIFQCGSNGSCRCVKLSLGDADAQESGDRYQDLRNWLRYPLHVGHGIAVPLRKMVY